MYYKNTIKKITQKES